MMMVAAIVMIMMMVMGVVVAMVAMKKETKMITNDESPVKLWCMCALGRLVGLSVAKWFFLAFIYAHTHIRRTVSIIICHS